ncbi:hypothetical protein [Paraburkholderia xenovorans]|uniref:hypothetical protein n=1 Tax=Paraburkholderia xenovorans TaxID=36873 RepID=UPI0038BD0C01
MPVNTLPDPLGAACTSLGSFLRDRRSRLQPGPDAPSRRRNLRAVQALIARTTQAA